MKLLLSFLFCIFCFSFASPSGSEFVKNDKTFHLEKNNIVFAQMLKDTSSGFSTQTPVKIYDNFEMQGNPVIILNNEKVVDLRNAKTQDYILKNYYRYIPSKTEREDGIKFEVKKLPIDFIVSHENTFMLQIEDYKNEVFTVEDHDIKYYFNSKSGLAEIRSASYLQADAINLLEKDTEFMNIINSYRSCIKAKDVNCFISIDAKAKYGIQEWTALDDYCPMATTRTVNDLEFAKLASEYTKLRPHWTFYEKFFNFKEPALSIELEKNIFKKSEKVSMSMSGEKKCDYLELIEINLERYSPDKVWKIIDIKTTVEFIP